MTTVVWWRYFVRTEEELDAEELDLLFRTEASGECYVESLDGHALTADEKTEKYWPEEG